MQHIINRTELVHEIRRLNVAEQLNIVTEIWDEIKESQELESVSEDEKIILSERLSNYKANPDSAVNWTDLQQAIHDRYNK